MSKPVMNADLEKCDVCGIPLNSEIRSETSPKTCKYCAEEAGKEGEMGHMPPPPTP